MSHRSPINLSSSPPRRQCPPRIRRPAPTSNPLQPNNVGRGASSVTRARQSSAQFARNTAPHRPATRQVYEIPSSSPAAENRPTTTHRSPSHLQRPPPNHASVHPPGNYDFIVKRIPLELIPLPKPPSPPPPTPIARDATLVELYAYNVARGVVLTQPLRREEWPDFTEWVEKHPQGPEADFHRRRKARLVKESQDLDAKRHTLWLNSQALNERAEMLCARLEDLKEEKRLSNPWDGQKERLEQRIHRVQAELDQANERWEENNREKNEVEANSWALTDVRWDRLPQWCRSER